MTNVPEEIAGIDLGSILQLEALPAENSVSYFSGSIVAGYGNAWSDIDVYVVGDRRPIGAHLTAERETTISIHYEFDRRIDFEFWDRLAVNRLARRLSEIQIGNALADDYFSRNEEAFIHRLRIGVTTKEQQAPLDELREQFTFELFRRYLVQKCLRNVDHLVEDVCGMVESGDFKVSILTARTMVGVAIDTYCHFLGNTDPSSKWRLHHLRLASSPDVEALEVKYFDLEIPGMSLRDASPADAKLYTDACLRFVNDIATMVQS